MPLQTSADESDGVTPEKRQRIAKNKSNWSTSSTRDKIKEVDAKEKLSDVGVIWLQYLMKKLEEKGQRQPDPVDKWTQEIRKILDRRLQRPNVTIALYGQTGSGKSSVISAVCDRDIVHCNAMQAGTQFITVIGYNHQATHEHPWRGEIQTISENEWADELQILLGDLHDLPDGEIPLPGSGTSASYSIAKILTIYKEADRNEVRTWTVGSLMNHADLRAVLGHNHQFRDQTLTKLKKQMEEFTGSRRRPRFSPLISIMKIFGPIEFLRRGLEIADIPGAGDSNAARCRVAEKYQSKVDAFWIVSPIVRAIDDNFAKELFGTAWKQQMQLDGKLTEEYITFIMTKCDDITVSQVITELDMEKDERVISLRVEERSVDHELRKKIKKRDRLERQISEQERVLQSFPLVTADVQGSRNSSPESACPPSSQCDEIQKARADIALDNRHKRPVRDSNEPGYRVGSPSKRQKVDRSAEVRDAILQQLNQSIDELVSERIRMDIEISKLKDKQQRCKSELTKIAISARNEFSVEHIRASFSKEAHEIHEEQENSSTSPAEILDSLPDILSDEIKAQTKELPVFCISSKAYEQHCRRNIDDQRVEGFPHINDTQIPQLREHCIAAALSAQETVTKRFSSDLKSLVSEMKIWAEDREPDRKISNEQRDSLLNAIKEPGLVCFTTIQESSRTALQNIKISEKRIKNGFTAGAASASLCASEIVARWFSKDVGLHWQTIRACARRHGSPYKSTASRYKQNVIEFNADLAFPFYRKIMKEWNALFKLLIPKESKLFQRDVHQAFWKFLESIEIFVAINCRTMSSKWNLLCPKLERLIDPTLVNISAIFDTLIEKARDIHRSLLAEISKAMRLAYDKCGAMKGLGSAIRNRSILEEHIKVVNTSMFEDAKKNMSSALNAAFLDLESSLSRETSATLKIFKNECREMVNIASNTVVLSRGLQSEKIALQAFILESITELKEAQSQVETTGDKKNAYQVEANLFADAAKVERFDSSAQVGEDDYVSEDSYDSGDEFDEE